MVFLLTANSALMYCNPLFLFQVPYILYHGAKPDRALLRRDIRHRHKISDDGVISSFPVVVTSYEIAMNDREFLMYETWKLMIVDEGHRIKNFNCRLIRSVVIEHIVLAFILYKCTM